MWAKERKYRQSAYDYYVLPLWLLFAVAVVIFFIRVCVSCSLASLCLCLSFSSSVFLLFSFLLRIRWISASDILANSNIHLYCATLNKLHSACVCFCACVNSETIVLVQMRINMDEYHWTTNFDRAHTNVQCLVLYELTFSFESANWRIWQEHNASGWPFIKLTNHPNYHTRINFFFFSAQNVYLRKSNWIAVT